MENKNTSIFNSLKRLFSTSVIVRNIGGKKLKVVDSDSLQSTSMAYLRDKYTRLYSTQYLGHQNDSNMMAYQSTRLELFRDYDSMDRDSLIATALDIYADEITVENEFGEILSIQSTNDDIKGILYNLFYDILNIEFNLWSWARNMCKYGDFYLVMDLSPEYGVFNVRPVSTYDMRRIENSDPSNPNYIFFQQESMGKDGKYENYQVAHFRLLSDSNWLPYGRSLIEPARRTWKQLCLKYNTYVWTSNGYKEIKDINIGDKVYSYDYNNDKITLTTVKKCLKTGLKKTFKLKTPTKNICLTEDHPVLVKNYDGVYEYKQVKYLNNDVIISPLTDNIYENIISIEVDEDECEVWDLEVESDLHNFIANGIVVHNCLLEDAMLIHRIVRAPEKRIFKIDVANIPPAEVDVYMNKLISKIKQTPFIDPKTGDYNLRYNMQNLTQDFYLPVRGSDSGNQIENLSGMQWDSIEDIEYLRNRLLAALKVPKAFLNYDEGVSGKSTLSMEDLRFAKSVKRIQKILISELNKIAITHLFIQGYKDDDLVNFKLELANPSTIFEQEKISLWADKVSLAKDMMDGKIMSRKWIYQNIFNMSGDEIQDEYANVVEDIKENFRLAKIEDEGIDPKAENAIINLDDEDSGENKDNYSGENSTPLQEQEKPFNEMTDREKKEFFKKKGKEGGRPRKLKSRTNNGDKGNFSRDRFGMNDIKKGLSIDSFDHLEELDRFLKDFDKKSKKELL